MMVGLLLFSVGFVSGENPRYFPDTNNIELYVKNLISSYNTNVKYFESNQPNFDSYKHYFPLYHEVGQNFEVICVIADRECNHTLNFIFVKISGDEPIFISDFQHVLDDYFSGVILCGPGSISQGNYFEYNNSNLYAEFVVSATFDDITNNTMVNSQQFANQLFNDEKNKIEVDKINEVWEPFTTKYFSTISSSVSLMQMEYKIDMNISNNKSFTYEAFLPMFQEFNKSVQVVFHQGDYWYIISHDGWLYSFFFLIVNCVILIVGIGIENIITKNKKIPKIFSTIIEGGFIVVFYLLLTNPPTEFSPVQKLIPIILALPLVIIPYMVWVKRKKKVTKPSKRRRKKLK